MSNGDAAVEIDDCTGPRDPLVPVTEVLSSREVFIGPRQEVRRVLPNKDRRMIGAWCFVDHYGADDAADQHGMQVPPHPHSGLQTVTWLLAGEVQHRDSLGSDAVVLPGQLNLMTSGPGIAHSEESPAGSSAGLHGIQFWVALPDEARHTAPRSFHQYRDLPVVDRAGLHATVVVGTFEGVASPALAFTPIVGAELVVDGRVTVALRRDFEYGVLAIDAGVAVDGTRLERSDIGYVGGGRTTLTLSTDGHARRVFLLGGEPFEEQLVMWWNFIGRAHDEIVAFRESWNSGPGHANQPGAAVPGSFAGGQFGVVVGYDGDRLMAPPMPTTRLRSRPRHR